VAFAEGNMAPSDFDRASAAYRFESLPSAALGALLLLIMLVDFVQHTRT
jgi:hypothetical protein